MKHLWFSILAILTTAVSLRADLATPPGSILVLRNLNSFPEYRFAYIQTFDFNRDPHLLPKDRSWHPIRSDKSYEFWNDITLCVHKGNGPFVPFARIKENPNSKAVQHDITIQETVGEGDQVKVKFTTVWSEKRKAASAAPARSSVPYFVLGAGSMVALILRRRRWAA